MKQCNEQKRKVFEDPFILEWTESDMSTLILDSMIVTRKRPRFF